MACHRGPGAHAGERRGDGEAGDPRPALLADVRPRGLPGGAIREPVGPLGLGWANAVTVLRILLIPVFVLLILADTEPAALAAALVFFAAAATDGLDGYIARRYDTATRTGQWLDPLADKLLISAPVITLTVLGRFPLWATVVIVVREVAVSILRAWLGTRGRAMPASPWGKAKTAAQILAVFLYIVPLGPEGDGLRAVALWLAVALTVWSGLDYLLRLGEREPRAPRRRSR